MALKHFTRLSPSECLKEIIDGLETRGLTGNYDAEAIIAQMKNNYDKANTPPVQDSVEKGTPDTEWSEALQVEVMEDYLRRSTNKDNLK